MRPETAISLAMLSLHSEREGGDLGFRRDLVGKLKQLHERHVPVSGIKLRPGIGGEYSDEVSDFVGKLAIAGYVIQESPIKLTLKGLGLIKDHLTTEMNDPDVRLGAEVLEIPSKTLKQEAAARG